MPRGRWTTALVALVAFLCVFVSACRGREALPQLVTVDAAGPRTLSVGDALEISGAGFPAKRRAKVTLVGTLHVPGQEADESFDLECDGQSDGPGKIAVQVTEAVAEGVLGKGYAATHGTFRGAIEVAFASVTPGAMPITGTLGDVVLDFGAPARKRAEVEAQRAEGKRLLAQVGLSVADQPADQGGLVVTAVAEDSPGAQAGLAVNDVIRGLDGWNVLDPADFVPSGRRKLSTLTVLAAADQRVSERQIAVEGYRPRASSDVLGVALVLGTAVLVLLFFASPLSRWISRLERAAAKKRAEGVRSGRGPWVVVLAAVSRMLQPSADPLSDVVPFITLLSVSGLLVVAPFGRRLIGTDLDVIVAWSLVLVMGLSAALASGTRAGTTRYSISRSLALAGWVLLRHLPALAGLACLVARLGSFALVDAVRAQGGKPWHALVVRSPLGLLELFLFLSPLFLDLRSSPRMAEDTLEVGPRAPSRAAWLEGAAALLTSGLAAALWLGGWAVPFSDRLGDDTALSAQVAGAALFLGKTWALFLLVMFLRAMMPLSTFDQAGRPLLTRGLPLSLVAAGGTFGWLVWDPPSNVKRAAAAVLTALILVGTAFVVRRLVATLRAGQRPPEVSPFV